MTFGHTYSSVHQINALHIRNDDFTVSMLCFLQNPNTFYDKLQFYKLLGKE